MGMTCLFYDAVFSLIARPARLPLCLPGLHQAVGSAAPPHATIVVAATHCRRMRRLLLLVMRGISRLQHRRRGCGRRCFLFLPLQRKEELFGAAESLLGTDLIGPAAAAGRCRCAILWRLRLGRRGRPRLRLEEAGGERLWRGQVLQPASCRSRSAP
jgi:hypothetical protein